MSCGDIVEFHEFDNFWVGFDLSGGFRGPSPGGMVSWRFPLPSFPRIPSVLRRVASFLVADEALSVPDVFCPLTWREIDLIYIHCVGIRSRGLTSW